jgi:triosephosphate isomerase
LGAVKKAYFGTNTKMYKTIEDTVNFVTELQRLTSDIDRTVVEVFVMPSFTAIRDARNNVTGELVKIGAQNMYWEAQGQFTGEISPVMLREAGAEIIMVGHSERRHVLSETDAETNKKVLTSLAHGFITLLCVGETSEQKKYGTIDEYLRTQLKTDLFGVKPCDAGKIWVAYEPMWAIGVDGTPASKEYAEEKHAVIKNTLSEIFGYETGNLIPVLYGGSVNNSNARELFAMPNIDGLFIGRAAWNAKNFNKIIRSTLQVCSDTLPEKGL